MQMDINNLDRVYPLNMSAEQVSVYLGQPDGASVTALSAYHFPTQIQRSERSSFILKNIDMVKYDTPLVHLSFLKREFEDKVADVCNLRQLCFEMRDIGNDYFQVILKPQKTSVDRDNYIRELHDLYSLLRESQYRLHQKYHVQSKMMDFKDQLPGAIYSSTMGTLYSIDWLRGDITAVISLIENRPARVPDFIINQC